MTEPKTQATAKSVEEFLETVTPDTKKEDSLTLLKIFKKVTGEKAVMWGDSIVGFGKYHYKSEKSKQEGDWFLVGFSPRKQNLTLYIRHGNEDHPEELKKLGKHKEGGGCLYISKLSDVDLSLLESLIKNSFQAERMYSVS